MSQVVAIEKPQNQSQEVSFLTNFSNVCIELICVEINRQLTLQLDHSSCLEDITKFLIEQKILHKSTEINYLLPNNPSPLHTFWTLRQIMEMYDLQHEDKLTFTVQIKDQSQENSKGMRRKKQVCCACEIF